MNQNGSKVTYYPIDEQAEEPAARPKSQIKYYAVPENLQINAEPKKASGLDEAKRLHGQFIMRGAEGAAGVTGDVGGLVSDLWKAGTGLKSAEPIPGIGSTKLERMSGFAKPPTTQQIRELGANLTEGKYEPQSRWEELGGNITSDFASLGIGKYAQPMRRALGLAVASNVAPEVLSDMGFSDSSQAASKLGTLMLGSLMFRGKGGMRRYAGDLYKEAEQLAGDARVSAKPIEDAISNIRKEIGKGTVTPLRKELLDQLGQIEGKIKDGSISVEEAVKTNQSVGDWLRSVGKADDIRSFGKGAQQGLRQSIDDYARINPAFKTAYNDANQIWGGLKQTRKIEEWITKHGDSIKSPVGMLVVAGSVAGASHALSELGLSKDKQLAGAGAVYAQILASRMLKNPAMRKYYLKTMGAAAEENKPLLLKNMAKLERELQKDVQDNPISEKEYAQVDNQLFADELEARRNGEVYE